MPQLQAAYEVEVMPREETENDSQFLKEPTRLMAAVKKRGFRGPKRVEISYGATSGHIWQVRFVDMPYGPERLTVRMTLLEANTLPANYYDHELHHDPNCVVEYEN